MVIEVREVRGKRGLHRFIAFPFRLYKGNPYWVPALRSDEMFTLRPDKNPAFEHCEARYFMAYKDGRPAGRVAGIINHKYAEIWGKKYARFGWLDFEDDPEVSAALLRAVEDWARSKGMEGIHGPMGFCDLDREGLLVEGFNELGTLATIYNHPYYPEHLEKLGYVKDADYVEFELTVPDEIPERIERITAEIMRRGQYRLVEAKKAKDLLPYAPGIFALINEAYEHLYGVVPLNEGQIAAFTKQYFPFVNPDLTKIILDKDGRIAAFGITMPSLSKALQKARGRLFPLGFVHILRALKHNDRLDLYLVAVRPELRNKAVNSILMTEINKAAIRHGLVKSESNPEWEENEQVQAQWKNYQARQHKRRRIYLKKLA